MAVGGRLFSVATLGLGLIGSAVGYKSPSTIGAVLDSGPGARRRQDVGVRDPVLACPGDLFWRLSH